MFITEFDLTILTAFIHLFYLIHRCFATVSQLKKRQKVNKVLLLKYKHFFVCVCVSSIHHSLQMSSGFHQHAQTGYFLLHFAAWQLTEIQTNTKPDPVKTIKHFGNQFELGLIPRYQKLNKGFK